MLPIRNMYVKQGWRKLAKQRDPLEMAWTCLGRNDGHFESRGKRKQRARRARLGRCWRYYSLGKGAREAGCLGCSGGEDCQGQFWNVEFPVEQSRGQL